MSWCDVTLCRSRPEGSARGRAALNATRRRGRAFQCLIAQCLMSGDHATFTSPSSLCPRRAYKRLYKTKPHEPLGAVRPGRRPAGGLGKGHPRGSDPKTPAPKQKKQHGKKVREGSALQDRRDSAGPGPRNEGRIAVCSAQGRVQGRESFPNFECCVCSSVGRLQTPPPFLPPPPFSANPSRRRTHHRARSGPRAAVCFPMKSLEEGYVVRHDISKVTSG